MAVLRVLAIALVVAGSCLFCFALLAAVWAGWAMLSGAGWPALVPAWWWIAAAFPGGVAMALLGREAMKRA
jgi:hypothetical protein